MKLLIILNEDKPRAHIDVHNAISELRDENKLDEYHIYPYIFRLQELKQTKVVVEEIFDLINWFNPSSILWAHTTKLKFSRYELEKLEI